MEYNETNPEGPATAWCQLTDNRILSIEEKTITGMAGETMYTLELTIGILPYRFKDIQHLLQPMDQEAIAQWIEVIADTNRENAIAYIR